MTMPRPSSLLVREHLDWLLETASERTRGNVSAIAQLLGVHRGTVHNWVKAERTVNYQGRREPVMVARQLESSPEIVTEDMPDFNLDRMRRRMIRRALGHTRGNMTKAAELLGIDRTTLYKLLEKYGERWEPSDIK